MEASAARGRRTPASAPKPRPCARRSPRSPASPRPTWFFEKVELGSTFFGRLAGAHSVHATPSAMAVAAVETGRRSSRAFRTVHEHYNVRRMSDAPFPEFFESDLVLRNQVLMTVLPSMKLRGRRSVSGTLWMAGGPAGFRSRSYVCSWLPRTVALVERADARQERDVVVGRIESVWWSSREGQSPRWTLAVAPVLKVLVLRDEHLSTSPQA